MAFKFAGDRGQYLMAALDAASQQKAKLEDTGRVLFSEGVANKPASGQFERVGAAGSFADDLAQFPKEIQARADQVFQFNRDFGGRATA